MARVDERPFLDRSFHTADLPPTPQRDYRISASRWIEAPEALLRLGEALGEPVEYKRRIGRFLLWRAGPPIGEARYLAVDPESGLILGFDLHGKDGEGVGGDGERYTRFRTWKESLLAASRTSE